MEFRYDLPKSQLERQLEQLDHFYEEMQSHPGEWVKLTGACFSPGNYYYSVDQLLRSHPKRYPHITVRTVDSAPYARYMVPVKQRRQAKLRPLWTAIRDTAEFWVPVLFTLGIAAIVVIALIVYK